MGLAALLIAIAIGVPLGIIAALNRNKTIDRFVMTRRSELQHPELFLGILLILTFSLWAGAAELGVGIWHLISVTLRRSRVACDSPAVDLDVLNKLHAPLRRRWPWTMPRRVARLAQCHSASRRSASASVTWW
jgi:hypothetical protein